MGNAIRGALYAGPAYLIGAGLGGSILGLALAAAAAGYYVKDYLDFVKF